MEPRVRIVSGGTSVDTIVYVDGKMMDNVTRATWSCDAEGGLSEATITFQFVSLDVDGAALVPVVTHS